MPIVRCKPGTRGGLLVYGGWPHDVKPGWSGVVPSQFLDGRYPFLEEIQPPAPVTPSPDELPIVILDDDDHLLPLS